MSIRARLEKVQNEIAAAAADAGRDPSAVRLVAVSKTHPVDVIRKAIAAGVTNLGENKVQEGLLKIADIGRGAKWHLIGHLQKNKVRKAVRAFDVIESVDSLTLAKRIDRIAGEEDVEGLQVLIQVDLASEETKFGITEERLEATAEFLAESKIIRFRGLMAIPPYFSDPKDARPYFRRLRELRDKLYAKGLFAGANGELSMGMSNDFKIAIEEGATIVRIGTAIFGERKRGLT